MVPATHAEIVNAVRQGAHRITGASSDYEPLLELIGDASFVLLGEASHGTHEFYRERERITRRLIRDKGFTAVAIEGDWPDAWRVNRHVRGLSSEGGAAEALSGFRRFPTWMWRNTEVVAFLDWLRAFNDSLPPDRPKAGFYGLDLYSLHSSMEAVLQYLETVDRKAARQARERYSCFDHFGEDIQVYGFLTGTGVKQSCEEGVVATLMELERRAYEYMRKDERISEEDAFNAAQNARLVKNAEEYYRAMFIRGESTWNLRDEHMAQTLDALVSHLQRHGERARVVVWAHNSHLGDARATEMGRQRGELNLGQLVRERFGADAKLIGMTTHHGTVSAATDWGDPVQRKTVRPARGDSYEGVFHAAGLGRFMLPLGPGHAATEPLHETRLERAIGVIYRPETERQSHYFEARLPDQFDAVLHFDETRALEPLERTSRWEKGELPETYPFGV